MELVRDARAGVFHRKDGFGAIALPAEDHPAVFRGEFHGVAQQVVDDLLDLSFVRLNNDFLGRGHHIELDGLACCAFADDDGAALHQRAQIEMAKMEVQLARLDLG